MWLYSWLTCWMPLLLWILSGAQRGIGASGEGYEYGHQHYDLPLFQSLQHLLVHSPQVHYWAKYFLPLWDASLPTWKLYQKLHWKLSVFCNCNGRVSSVVVCYVVHVMANEVSGFRVWGLHVLSASVFQDPFVLTPFMHCLISLETNNTHL